MIDPLRAGKRIRFESSFFQVLVALRKHEFSISRDDLLKALSSHQQGPLKVKQPPAAYLRVKHPDKPHLEGLSRSFSPYNWPEGSIFSLNPKLATGYFLEEMSHLTDPEGFLLLPDKEFNQYVEEAIRRRLSSSLVIYHETFDCLLNDVLPDVGRFDSYKYLYNIRGAISYAEDIEKCLLMQKKLNLPRFDIELESYMILSTFKNILSSIKPKPAGFVLIPGTPPYEKSTTFERPHMTIENSVIMARIPFEWRTDIVNKILLNIKKYFLMFNDQLKDELRVEFEDMFLELMVMKLSND